MPSKIVSTSNTCLRTRLWARISLVAAYLILFRHLFFRRQSLAVPSRFSANISHRRSLEQRNCSVEKCFQVPPLQSYPPLHGLESGNFSCLLPAAGIFLVRNSETLEFEGAHPLTSVTSSVPEFLPRRVRKRRTEVYLFLVRHTPNVAHLYPDRLDSLGRRSRCLLSPDSAALKDGCSFRVS